MSFGEEMYHTTTMDKYLDARMPNDLYQKWAQKSRKWIFLWCECDMGLGINYGTELRT